MTRRHVPQVCLDKLAEHAVWSLKCFPDWEWYNIKVFETDDPNHFWVECDGHGKILFPGYPEGYYENHFLHSFELDVKLTPESVTTYLYGPDGQLLGEAEHNGSGRKLRAQYYLWLDSLPLATIDADYDAQGKVGNPTLLYLIKLTPESVTTYLYGPDGQLLGEAEHDGSGRKLRAQYYLWLDSLPLATIDADYDAQGKVGNPTLLYLLGDHHDPRRRPALPVDRGQGQCPRLAHAIAAGAFQPVAQHLHGVRRRRLELRERGFDGPGEGLGNVRRIDRTLGSDPARLAVVYPSGDQGESRIAADTGFPAVVQVAGTNLHGPLATDRTGLAVVEAGAAQAKSPALPSASASRRSFPALMMRPCWPLSMRLASSSKPCWLEISPPWRLSRTFSRSMLSGPRALIRPPWLSRSPTESRAERTLEPPRTKTASGHRVGGSFSPPAL